MSNAIAKHIQEFERRWEERYRKRLPVDNLVELPRRRWNAVEHRWKYGVRRPQNAKLSKPPDLERIEEEDEEEDDDEDEDDGDDDGDDGEEKEAGFGVSRGGFNSEIQADRMELNPDNGGSRKRQTRDFDPPAAVGPFPAKRVKRLIRHTPASSGHSPPSAPLFPAPTFGEAPETTRMPYSAEDCHATYSETSALVQAAETLQALSNAGFSTGGGDPMTIQSGQVFPPATTTHVSTAGRSSEACSTDSHDDFRPGLGVSTAQIHPISTASPSPKSSETPPAIVDPQSVEHSGQPSSPLVYTLGSCDAPGSHWRHNDPVGRQA